ncbi:triose-phosphate isomerase [Sulfurimonas sp.]|uniref:triose-phosphate isomerase n=1 Tax=Sulfurimonas sp. TaxID=2022749 RepID=UPI002AB2FD94|nr:triose-phosphate isomerase [Sulfurimonas sp.]
MSQEVLVFPAISSLDSHEGKVTLGAQNAYATINGAFTGEIGLEQLEEFGIKTILIGHSERRHVLGETQEELVEKFNFYKELGFRIVYCVGEPLEIRESSNEEMMEYISAQYEGIDAEYDNLVIAYEPVWAIGTGLTPTLRDIELLHLALKQKSKAPLLYGGSVKVSNVEEVLSIENVDGVLVGGASLIAKDFAKMCDIAQDIADKE